MPTLEQQLLGLVWRGGKIDHPPGEHDDLANAVAGVLHLLIRASPDLQIFGFDDLDDAARSKDPLIDLVGEGEPAADETDEEKKPEPVDLDDERLWRGL